MYDLLTARAVSRLCVAALVVLTGAVLRAQDEGDDEVPVGRGVKPKEEAKPASAPAAAAKAEQPAPATAAPTTTEAKPPEAAAAAATVPAPPPAPAAAAGPVRLQVGAYTVESSSVWKPDARLTPRPPDLWQVTMHGVVDVFAKPSAWEDLLSVDQPTETWLDKSWLLQGNALRVSTMPSLKVGPGQVLVTGKPLVPADGLLELGGKTIRVFVWLSGKETGQGRYLWEAVPRADVLMTDGRGKVVSVHRGLMATRGTFPWRCFYRDVAIPDPLQPLTGAVADEIGDGVSRSRGLYLRLSNPASGTAWFSTPSWEVVGRVNTYALGDLQDPLTGSMAPNPRFDELPVHLASPSVRYHGTSPAYGWAFLGGPQRGAVNVMPVLSKAGLEAYLKTVAASDPHHLLHGVARLPEWLHAGTTFGCLPPAEPDLLQFLGERMVALQDAETGFWGYAQAPRSLALTAAVVERMFGGWAFRRADQAAMAQPWLACNGLALGSAEAIVKTVLALQGTADEARQSKGGWSAAALTSADPGLVAMDTACSLAATADAVFLLRRCGEGQGPAVGTRCERAIREAIEQVWAACLLPSGLWQQSSRDGGPTVGGVMARLIEASPLLEFRSSPQVRPPQVPEFVVPEDGVVRVTWTAPGEEAVALRLYVLPEGVTVDRLGDQYLAGILGKNEGSVGSSDPLLAVLAMRRQGRLQWGAGGFEEGAYTLAKLKGLPEPLPTSMRAEPLAVALPRGKVVSLFVCAVNAYGETSRPVPIAIRQPGRTPQTAPAETEGTATEAEAGETPAAGPAATEQKPRADGEALPAAEPEQKPAEAPAQD